MFRRAGTRWTSLLGVSILVAPLGGLLLTADPTPSIASSPTVVVASPVRDDRSARAPHVLVTTTVSPTTTTSAPPATTTTAAPEPPAASAQERAQAAYLAFVPAAWRAVLPAEIAMIGGSTSWGFPSGRIEVSASHASRGPVVLNTTVTHEYGHLIVWRYGSLAFYGAAPAGWPAFSGHPAEAWADCVAYAFTGNPEPSHGLPACPTASLDWTRRWLAAGPAAHPRTG